MSDVVHASKFLSLVLRHKPETIGITLDEQGWVDVEVLLKALNGKVDRAMLLRVVEENNKKRFEFSSSGLRIRASQGHSIPVDLGYAVEEPPSILYHGTPIAALPAIRANGLQKMSRHAVHLSEDEATAKVVGSRHGRAVVLQVYAGTMQLNGAGTFSKSTNGVWLTDCVPRPYIIFPCSECYQQMDRHYMVREDVWAASGTPRDEMLHVACLQQRLRRKLVEADFTDVPINVMNGFIPPERCPPRPTT